jgi:hypothetical protein
MKPLRLTGHALVALEERGLSVALVERTVRAPDWRESDPSDPSVARLFAALPERDGRILRVACVETSTEIRILTAFLDRRARRPE